MSLPYPYVYDSEAQIAIAGPSGSAHHFAGLLPVEDQTPFPTEGTATTTKRKSAPRKLDSEKCQLCLQHKVKCNPQPRLWPQRCKRCKEKGLGCSAPEVKRRANRRPRQASEFNPIAEQTQVERQTLDRGKPDSLWDWADLTDIIIFSQLMNKLLEFHDNRRSFIGGKLYDKSYKYEYPHLLADKLGLLQNTFTAILRNRLSIQKDDSAEVILIQRALDDIYVCFNMTGGRCPTEVVEKFPISLRVRNQLSKFFIPGFGFCFSVDRELGILVSLTDQYTRRLPSLLRRFLSADVQEHTEATAYHWDRLLEQAIFISSLSGEPDDTATPEKARYVLQDWICELIHLRRDVLKSMPGRSWNAIRSGNWDLSHLAFFTHKAGLNVVDEEKHSLLHVAMISGKSAVALKLLRLGVDVGDDKTKMGLTIFHCAAALGDIAVYEELRKQQQHESMAEDMESLEGELPLHIAARNGHTKMVEAILSTHADEPEYINRTAVDGNTPLSVALRAGKNDTVIALAKHPNIDFMTQPDKNVNILHSAADQDQLDLFRFFLDKVPEDLVNMKDNVGDTPLHHLAVCGDRETIDAVLRISSIQPDLENDSGETPLCEAMRGGNLQAVKALAIRRDVDVSNLQRPLRRSYTWISWPKFRRYHDILIWLRDNCKELADDFGSLDHWGSDVETDTEE